MKINYTKYIQALVVILLMIETAPAFAQVLATSEDNGSNGACKDCSVKNASLAVDADLNTYSILIGKASNKGAFVYQEYFFPKTAAPKSYFQMVIESNNGSVLDEKSLAGLSITTYQDGKSNKDEKDIKDVLLSPVSGSSTKYSILVQIDDTFNEVQFRLNGVAKGGGIEQLNVYYVMFTEPVSLPVTLISFAGESINSTIELEWTCSSESDNNNFIVERSVDAIQFEEIAIIHGEGTTSAVTNYFYSDSSPTEGSNFYRLKSIDNNGASHYYEIIEVINTLSEKAAVLTIGSNPFQESLKVYYQTSKAGNTTIQLIDTDGAEHYVNTVQTEAGTNVYTITNLENVKIGVYSIIIRTENGVFVEKVVKM